MKIRLFILIFFLSNSILYSQTDANIKKLFLKINDIQSDSAKVKVLCDIAWAYRDYKPDSTIYYADIGISLAKKINYTEMEIQARAFKGVGYRNIGEYNKAQALYNENLTLAKKHNFKKRIAYSYLNLGNINLMQSNYLSAIDKIIEAIKIGEEIKDTNILGYAYINLARTYEENEDFERELNAHLKSLELRKTQNNIHDIAVSERETGTCYYKLNEYDTALSYFNLSLEKFKIVNSLASIGLISQSIGLVYLAKKEYKESEKYFKDALKYFNATKYKAGTAETENYRCKLFFEQKKYNKALQSALKALKIAEEIKMPKYAMLSSKYISDIYELKGDILQAYKYFKIYDENKSKTEKSKYIREFTKITVEFEYKKEKEKESLLIEKKLAEDKKEKEKQRIIKNSFISGFFVVLFFLILVYINSKIIKNKNKALTEKNIEIKNQREEIEIQAEKLSIINEEIKNKSEIVQTQNILLEDINKNITLLSEIGQEITSCLSATDIIDTTYANVNKLMKASVFAIGIYNKQRKRIDFIDNEEKEKTLKFHFEKLTETNSLSVICFNKQESILINDFSIEYKKYTKERPTSITEEIPQSLIYIPLTLKKEKIGVLTIQSFTKNSYTSQHLEILKNIGINISIAIENAESYKLIEQKNKEINSAVKYARKLQTSIMPTKEEIDLSFENFLIFKPRDVVSGDFYWHKVFKYQEKTITYLSVADCTGHGIPGALMSGIGIGLLNEIINNTPDINTDDILENLHSGIKNIFLHEQNKNNDGMDIAIIKITNTPEKKAKLCFSGAKRPLIYYDNTNSELKVIRGNIKTIGSNYIIESKFTKTEFELNKNDKIWLTSDGFSDQNNKERKKIGSQGLIKLLTEIADEELDQQKEIINTFLKKHMNNIKQRDDITVLGIKI